MGVDIHRLAHLIDLFRQADAAARGDDGHDEQDQHAAMATFVLELHVQASVAIADAPAALGQAVAIARAAGPAWITRNARFLDDLGLSGDVVAARARTPAATDPPAARDADIPIHASRGEARAIPELRSRRTDEPTIYPCGCSWLKVSVGRCDVYDADGNERSATDAMSPVEIQEMLALTSTYVRFADVARWTDEQRQLAADWALAAHLRASDHDIDVPPRPDFLPFSEGDAPAWWHEDVEEGTGTNCPGCGSDDPAWMHTFEPDTCSDAFHDGAKARPRFTTSYAPEGPGAADDLDEDLLEEVRHQADIGPATVYDAPVDPADPLGASPDPLKPWELSDTLAFLEQRRTDSGMYEFTEGQMTDLRQEVVELRRQNAELARERDNVYVERTHLVALVAAFCRQAGLPVGLGQHDPNDTTWDPAWRTIVFADIPDGVGGSFQASWHVGDRDRERVAHLPAYATPWDGHSTREKYLRIAAAAERLATGTGDTAIARWQRAETLLRWLDRLGGLGQEKHDAIRKVLNPLPAHDREVGS